VGAISLKVDTKLPSRQNLEAAVSDIIASMHGPPHDMLMQIRSQMLAAPPPERLPPYSDLLVDHAGLLWTVLSVPGDVDTRLRALTPAGVPVADLRIARNLRVYEIGEDYILGAYANDEGEQHVTVFTLRRSG
jgi:hypothetical protein